MLRWAGDCRTFNYSKSDNYMQGNLEWLLISLPCIYTLEGNKLDDIKGNEKLSHFFILTLSVNLKKISDIKRSKSTLDVYATISVGGKFYLNLI